MLRGVRCLGGDASPGSGLNVYMASSGASAGLSCGQLLNGFHGGVLCTLPAPVLSVASIRRAMPGWMPVDRSLAIDPDDSRFNIWYAAPALWDPLLR